MTLCPLDLTLDVTVSVQTFFLIPEGWVDCCWSYFVFPTLLVCLIHYPAGFCSFLSLKKLFIWLHQVLVVACRIFDLCCSMQDHSCGMWDLVPWPEIQPGPPALGVQSLSRWTIRDVPVGSCSIPSSTHSAEHMVGSFLNQWMSNRNLTEEFLIVAILLEYHFSEIRVSGKCYVYIFQRCFQRIASA